MNASILGWAFAAEYGEVMAGLHASAFINANRDPKKKPIVLPAPWDSTDTEEQVSPAEKERLKELLRRHSAFTD